MLMARRYDPVAVDLVGVQNLHATRGSPSRFLLHALKLVILELKSKPATENEAEPIKRIFPSIMALIKSRDWRAIDRVGPLFGR